MSVHRIRYKDKEFTVTVKKTGDWYEVFVEDEHFCATLDRGVAHLARGGARFSVESAVSDGRVFSELNGRLFECERVTEDNGSGGDHGHAGEKDKVYAPMPGKIVKLNVSIGDTVNEKQALVVVESMKMENPVLSPSDGVVKKINFSAGDQVDTDKAIIELDVDRL